MAERGEWRQPGHRPRQVKDRGGRHVAILGSHRPVDGRQAARLRLAPDGREQPRLADPGLAGEQQELAPACDDVVEPPIGEDEQVVTPDEERTADGSGCGTHRVKCRRGSSRVIGHSTDDPRRRGSIVRGDDPDRMVEAR